MKLGSRAGERCSNHPHGVWRTRWRKSFSNPSPNPASASGCCQESLLQNAAAAASVTAILSPPDKVHSTPWLSLRGAFYFQPVWNQALAQGGWAEDVRSRTRAISHLPAGVCDEPWRKIEGRATKSPPAWLCLSPGLPANCRQRESSWDEFTTATLPGFLH